MINGTFSQSPPHLITNLIPKEFFSPTGAGLIKNWECFCSYTYKEYNYNFIFHLCLVYDIYMLNYYVYIALCFILYTNQTALCLHWRFGLNGLLACIHIRLVIITEWTSVLSKRVLIKQYKVECRPTSSLHDLPITSYSSQSWNLLR